MLASEQIQPLGHQGEEMYFFQVWRGELFETLRFSNSNMPEAALSDGLLDFTYFCTSCFVSWAMLRASHLPIVLIAL